MTKLLKEVLAKVSRLPAERQDELAALLLAEMDSDARWDEAFAKSQSALERFADEALDEHRRGDTRPLDEVIRDDTG